MGYEDWDLKPATYIGLEEFEEVSDMCEQILDSPDKEFLDSIINTKEIKEKKIIKLFGKNINEESLVKFRKEKLDEISVKVDYNYCNLYSQYEDLVIEFGGMKDVRGIRSGSN